MSRDKKPSGKPTRLPVRFETESGMEFSMGKAGCFAGGCCMYRLTPAEAHQIGLAMAKWGLGALQGEEVADDLGS